MLWNCCTQYASKFGKLSSGHRTGKGQFSFQSQRKAMPKNAQITAQLHSSHMLAKWCSKFSKPGLNSTWTMNFQMFKLYLEKAEEPEIKLPTSVGSSKSKRVTEKHLLLLYWLCQSLWLCGSQQTGKFLKRWEYQTTLPASWEICMQDRKQQLEPDCSNQQVEQQLVPNWERNTSRLYIVRLLIYLICRVYHEKCWTEWSINWNQDYQEKYQ